MNSSAATRASNASSSFGILEILDLRRLLKFGRVHGCDVAFALPGSNRGTMMVSGVLILPAHNWKWFMVRGVIALALGIGAIVFALSAVFAFTMVFAAYCFIDGIASLVAGVRGASEPGHRWGALILSGIIGILIGIIVPGNATRRDRRLLLRRASDALGMGDSSPEYWKSPRRSGFERRSKVSGCSGFQERYRSFSGWRSLRWCFPIPPHRSYRPHG